MPGYVPRVPPRLEHSTIERVKRNTIVVATISSGEPSTLKTYRRIALILTGEDSPATKMLDEKIAEQGEDMEVIQEESQMMMLIVSMAKY